MTQGEVGEEVGKGDGIKSNKMEEGELRKKGGGKL